jgi:hypothetical protein
MPQDPDMPGLRTLHPGSRRPGAPGLHRGPRAAGGGAGSRDGFVILQCCRSPHRIVGFKRLVLAREQ